VASGSLTQDFDAHVPLTFAEIPDAPSFANRWARLKRWCTIAFVESWLAVFLFRLKLRLRAAGVPALPVVCDLISRAAFGVQIGNRVQAGRGLMITHGNVVIDGRVSIGRNCQINPWVTIGLSNSRKLGFSIDGPTIGDRVRIGTGAKIIGPVTIGDYARIGANAVVVNDVPANVTVVGAPARIVARGTPPPPAPTPNGASAATDAALVARMRTAVADYRLHLCSLRALLDTLIESFESGSERLRALHEHLRDDLVFLDAVAATGGDETPQVGDALASIDAALERDNVRSEPANP
jgi:serine O-acetyltransferase